MEAAQVFADCWTGKKACCVHTGERRSGCTEKEWPQWAVSIQLQWDGHLGDIMLNEAGQSQRDCVWFPPWETSRGADPQRQRAGCRLPGRRGGCKSLSEGHRVSVLQDEESSGTDGGDGCTAVWMCLMPRLALQNAWDGNAMYILPR